MPSAAGVWTKIVEGEFDPENDYIVAYKIYTDGLWQQVCVQNQIMTFEIKEDGIYSFCTYGGMIGNDTVLIISSFK